MSIRLCPSERELLLALLSGHLDGQEARVFGSRVGSSLGKPHADLDLLLLGAPLSLDRRAALLDELRESALPFSVDVVEAHRLQPEFLQRVLAQSQPLWPAVAAA